jgi:O-antigen ligase
MTYAIPDLFWNRAAIADHAAVMVGICMAFAVAYAWQHRRILYLTGWFWISSFFVVNRTGILGSFGALAGFVLNRYRIKSLPIIAGLFMAGLAIFMYIDTLRQHLFDNPYKVNPVYYMKNPLQIDIQNIDDSGRFEIWEIVMERFFRPNPLIGSGLGSTQNWFYTIDYTRIKVEHSSYVRLLCDTGLIGCGLYVASLLSFIIIALKPIKREKNKDELFAQYAVCGSVAAIICCMGFDNIINYQLAANQYPFAIGGIYLGLIDKPVKANGDNEQWPVLSEENRTVQNQTRRTLNSY